MFLRHNTIGILWAVFIFMVGSLPSSEFPVTLPFQHFDKVVHFFLYALLTLFLVVGFKKQYQYRRLRKYSLRYSFLISGAYGLIIEFLQGFVFSGRSIETSDIIANFSGIVFGYLVFFVIYGKTPKQLSL